MERKKKRSMFHLPVMCSGIRGGHGPNTRQHVLGRCLSRILCFGHERCQPVTVHLGRNHSVVCACHVAVDRQWLVNDDPCLGQYSHRGLCLSSGMLWRKVESTRSLFLVYYPSIYLSFFLCFNRTGLHTYLHRIQMYLFDHHRQTIRQEVRRKHNNILAFKCTLPNKRLGRRS